MKLKIYYENVNSTMGGHQIISIFRLLWWLFLGRIYPNEKSDTYYIRRIETIKGTRI